MILKFIQFNINIIAVLLIPLINAEQSLQCGDWDVYKDEKCIKVFDNKLVQYYEDAKNTCYQNEGSSIISIRSQDEQDFIFNLLVKTHKIVNGVWIGAQYKENFLKWTDNSIANFTNWAENNPRNDSEYECIQMSLVEPYKGKWLNEPCNQNYVVVCEKRQNWLFSYLQQTVMELREAVDKTNKELAKTNNELQSTKINLQNEITKATPSGTIAYFSSTAVPLGWLKANGQLVSRTTYTSLFAAIGTTFGSGDDNTFKLPDLRGEFIRGFSDGRDVDKTRVLGSFQGGSIFPWAHAINSSWAAGSLAHTHQYGRLAGYTFDDGYDEWVPSGETRNGFKYPNDPTITEMYYTDVPKKGFITMWNALRGSRPRNIALLACIKY